MKLLKNQFGKAALIFIGTVMVFGILYPALIYGISHLFFDHQASGSFKETEYGKMSTLAGQSYQDDGYLWGRKQSGEAILKDGKWLWMATPADHAIDDLQYMEQKQSLKEEIQMKNPDADGAVPEELYTYSASGMDPHISYSAAMYQVFRIAKERGISEDVVASIIESESSKDWLSDSSEPLVHVTNVNLKLDELQ